MIESGKRAVAAPSRPNASRSGRVLAIACLGLFIVFLQVTQTIATLTTVQDDLGLGAADLTWIPSVYTLAVASGVLAAGAVADRVGQKTLFLSGTAVMAAGSAFLVAAESFRAVLLAQAITGVGAAIVLPTSLALITRTFTEPTARASAIAVWAASSGAGLAVGPLNAGVVTRLADWNWVFALNVVVALAVLVAGSRTLVEHRPRAGGRPDLLGMLLSTAVVTLVVFGVIEGGRTGYAEGRVAWAFVGAAALVVAFTVWERRVECPMLDVRLLARRSYAGALLGAAAVMFLFVGVTLLQLLWMQEVRDLDVLESALHLQASFGGFIASSVTAGRLMRRGRSPRALVLLGLGVAIIGAVAFMSVEPTTSFVGYGPLLVLFGAGCGMANAPSTALAVTGLPAGAHGVASGTVNAARQLGAVLGTSVLGASMTARFGDYLVGELERGGMPRAAGARIADAVAGGAASVDLDQRTASMMAESVRMAFTEAVVDTVGVGAITVLILLSLSAWLTRSQSGPRSRRPNI